MANILIVDINSQIYRHANALKKLTTFNGQLNGGIFGTLNTIATAIKKYNIDHILVAEDVKRSSLKRREMFSEYKAHRKETDPDIIAQSIEMKKFLDLLQIPRYQIEGNEADDVIASLAQNLKQDKNNQIYVLTSDKDIAQILDENVYIVSAVSKLDEKNAILKTPEDVVEKLGVYPEQIPALFGFIGDSSDGIPGVKGVGDKFSEYVREYKTVDNIFENIDNLPKKYQNKIRGQKDIVLLSEKLATVVRDLKIDIKLKNIYDVDITEFLELCRTWELKKIIDVYQEIFNSKTNSIKIDEDYTVVSNINEFNVDKKSYFFENEYGYSILSGKQIYVHIYAENSLFSIIEKDASKLLDKSTVFVFNYKNAMHKNFVFNNFVDTAIMYHLISDFKAKNLEEAFENDFLAETYKEKTNIIKKMDLSEFIEYKKQVLKTRAIYLKEISDKYFTKLNRDLSLLKLYETLEKPLIKVLYSMEVEGIKVDVKYFKDLKIEFEKIIQDLENKIYEKSSEEFNINSPKSLSEVLFNKLGMPVIKKTKEGYSADSFVLEQLSKMGHSIATDILDYRKYTKLLTTYIEVFLDKVDENDRLHTTFSQTTATTGRLSSENPNLQTIPSRTKEGFMIRKGLIASNGYTLLSCDYSQIELRVLASITKDPKLIMAYKNNLDLHTETAKKLFRREEISKDERDVAKIINFSVLYGKTPFGLSKELSITVSQASDYINSYFKEYSGVKKYIDDLVEKTKELGYVETLFKTRRYIPGINSKNKTVFEQAKRIAVNTVIQGTASNILKLVMISLYNKISKYGKILIQVHDELVFEIKDDLLDEAIKDIVDTMENTFKLEEVDLKVNYQYGHNWSHLK